MIYFEDTRTPAMKAADLEQSQVRLELQAYREELTREGCDEATILCGQIDDLEDRLVRLYCAHYELQSELKEALGLKR